MEKKGIIFDLDGVIVDTAKYHYMAWKNIAERLGYAFTEKDNEELKGVSRVKSLDILLKKAGKSLSEEEKNRLLIEKNRLYLTLVEQINEKEMLPGMKEIVNWLKNKQIPFALGSASKNAPFILEKLKIKNDFAAIIDGNNVTKAKPDPEVFLKAAEKLNLPPDRCVVVEDAQAGIEAAKKAGMLTIGIGEYLKLADYILKDTRVLTPEFLSRILSKKENENE